MHTEWECLRVSPLCPLRNVLDVWDKTVELKLSKSAFGILKTALGWFFGVRGSLRLLHRICDGWKWGKMYHVKRREEGWAVKMTWSMNNGTTSVDICPEGNNLSCEETDGLVQSICSWCHELMPTRLLWLNSCRPLHVCLLLVLMLDTLVKAKQKYNNTF